MIITALQTLLYTKVDATNVYKVEFGDNDHQWSTGQLFYSFWSSSQATINLPREKIEHVTSTVFDEQL